MEKLISRKDFKEKFGKKIRILRKQKEWTQEELADRLGLSDSSAISQIERGLKGMTPQKILEAAELFEIPVSSLLTHHPMPDEDIELSMKFAKIIWQGKRHPLYDAVKSLIEMAYKENPK